MRSWDEQWPRTSSYLVGLAGGVALTAAISVAIRQRPDPPAFGDPPRQAYVGCFVGCDRSSFDSRIDFQMPEEVCRTAEVEHCQHAPLFAPRAPTLAVPRLCYFSDDIQGMR